MGLIHDASIAELALSEPLTLSEGRGNEKETNLLRFAPRPEDSDYELVANRTISGSFSIPHLPLRGQELCKNRMHPELIFKAMQAKLEVVRQDPHDKGMRRILNFGHTIGHALENISHYAIPHGEAVALGCLVESHLSMSLNYLSASDFSKIQKMYGCFTLKLPKSYSRAQLLKAMSHDKKKAEGEMRFVLIDKIGHALPFQGAFCRPVVPHALEATLNWMEQRYL